MSAPAYLPTGGTQRASEQDLRATPAQFLVSPGVRAYAIAMIEAAWADLHARSDPKWRRVAGDPPNAESAREWITEHRDLMSFEACCQALGLDPEAVREVCLTTAPQYRQGRRTDLSPEEAVS